MNRTLLELLIEQLKEALEVLEDVDEAAEGRGMLKAAIKTANRLQVSQ